MQKKLFMAVDLGTSFIKTGVYSLDGDFHGGCTLPVEDERPAPGVFIQRGESLFQTTLMCLKQTAAQLGGETAYIRAIAFTGQMAGSMGVDENWEDITSWSCSLDSRYLPYADRQRALFAEKIFSISGTNAPVMCAKYDWFRNEFPEEHRRIAKYVMLGGYMIGRLSQIPVSEAAIDTSLIAWTGMADIRNRRWSEELCGDMGIDMAHLPRIVGCTATGGYLDETIARKLSLPSGIPLILGAGDKLSGCVGAGALEEGDMVFEAGSYGAISCMTRDVRLDSQRHSYDVIGSIDSQSFCAHKYMQGSGIAMDWFVDEFFRQDGEARSDAFRRGDAAAAQVPAGSGNMLSIGLLGGSAMPFNSELRGMFIGHTWSHSKAHFYRALLESFAYDLTLTLQSMARQYALDASRPIKLIGGGAKSPILPQILADVTGYRFARLERRDAALWGAALLAAAGTGEISDLRAAAAGDIRFQNIFEPDRAMTRRYAPYLDLYSGCVRELNDLYRQLNSI